MKLLLLAVLLITLTQHAFGATQVAMPVDKGTILLIIQEGSD
jgi:hypothetical protein